MNGEANTNLSVSRCRYWKVEYNRDNPLPLSYGKGNGFSPASILQLRRFYAYRNSIYSGRGTKHRRQPIRKFRIAAAQKAKQSGSTVNTSKANRDLTAVRLEPIKRMRTGSPYAKPINRYPHRQKIASIVRNIPLPCGG